MIILIVIISLSVLIFVHELGHFLTAKFFGVKVEEFGLGFPPSLFKKKIGETVYSINVLPFGGFVKIFGEEDVEAEQRRLSTPAPERSSVRDTALKDAEGIGVNRRTYQRGSASSGKFIDQPMWKRSAIMLAGVLMNVLLGWFVFSTVFAIGAPEHLLVVEVAPGSPAETAGLQDGDVVLEVRYGGEHLSDPIKSKNFVDLVTQSPGGPFFLTALRGSDTVEVTLKGRLDPPEGQGPLGVSLVDIGFPAQSLVGSVVDGFTTTISTLALVAVGFFNFFVKLFVSPDVLETVAGPVGIFVLATQAGSLGIVYLLQLMAFISVNLAILNLIPFPALDGGRFLMLIIEKIKGSPIPRRLQIAVNAAGFMALIILMVLITIRDVGRLIN